jgi:REP element-mobilizing transposase RayT
MNKSHFFGEISNSRNILSSIGEIASRFWIEIPLHFPDIKIDEYVIMPNHVHGIIVIHSNITSEQLDNIDFNKSHSLPKPKSLSSIIRSYKSAVTRWARANGWSSFAWQPRFYDHIIRDDEDLRRIRKYIQENPYKWELDEYFTPTSPRSYT